MDLTSSIGLERLQRAAILQLATLLNDKIDDENTLWAARDTAFFTSLYGAPRTITVEHVETTNFYAGHRPSLIEAPIERYPNCSAMAYTSTPKGSNDDHGEMLDLKLAVELMAKSVVDEEEVNSMIQRMADAAVQVFVNADFSFGGIVPVDGMPTVTLGDVFVRREEKGRGTRWFWQGARLEFSVDKFAIT